MVHIELGINGAFLTRRWAEPENWMRLTRELGFHNHEFCADVLDPFFSGNRAYQLQTARAVREAAIRHKVHLTDIYTGVATHRFHGLSHPDRRVRARMRTWIRRAMELALEMGTDRLGGHWDAIPVELMQDPNAYQQALRRQWAEFRALARAAKPLGMAALYQEQMYIPSEAPWTIAQAEQFLVEVNRGNDGVPVYLTIDVGHQAGEHYGAQGEDICYISWLRRLASVSEIIHLQQTTRDASHHWPFTAQHNRMGHVRIKPLLEAIRVSHAQHSSRPFARWLAPVQRTYLVAEIIPGSTKTESALLAELHESSHYLHQYVPAGGLTLA